MSKELEELNNLNNENVVYVHKDYWNEIKKKLKALEIIKEHTLYCENVDCFVFVNVTKEVNEFLKEVLL